MSKFEILNAVEYYRELPHQKKAFELLWQACPEAKKAEFVEWYRNNSAETKQEPVSLIVKPALQQTIKLPGGQIVGLDSPIIANGHFSWREAINSDLRRVPKEKAVVQNIIKIATYLEELRGWFGDKPIKITSFYRPPAINKSVGGVSNSRHTLGDAVDLSVPGLNPLEVEATIIAKWKHGGIGRGQRKHRGFTHVDCRGYRAVWDY